MRADAATLDNLLHADELPKGFDYPKPFVDLVRFGGTSLVPWHLSGGDYLRSRMAGLATRYPARRLIPFAYRQDMDDVACFNLDGKAGAVVVIHDFATPGWERPRDYSTFDDWVRRGLFVDMADFLALE